MPCNINGCPYDQQFNSGEMIYYDKTNRTERFTKQKKLFRMV